LRRRFLIEAVEKVLSGALPINRDEGSPNPITVIPKKDFSFQVLI